MTAQEIQRERLGVPARGKAKRRESAVIAGIIVLSAAAIVGWYVNVQRQRSLPFAGLDHPSGVAVDSAGDVYVINTSRSPVLKLAAGANTQSVLPFIGDIASNAWSRNFGGPHVNRPEGVAVDRAGTVFVADWGHFMVFKSS